MVLLTTLTVAATAARAHLAPGGVIPNATIATRTVTATVPSMRLVMPVLVLPLTALNGLVPLVELAPTLVISTTRLAPILRALDVNARINGPEMIAKLAPSPPVLTAVLTDI
jgi:hypothetical protein